MIRREAAAQPLAPNEAAEISCGARAVIFDKLADLGVKISSHEMDRAVTEADILALVAVTDRH
jgi:hypothetical protein